jgi:hypothetical protein
MNAPQECAGGCGKLLRPRTVDPNAPEWAGTVQVSVKGMCGACYRTQTPDVEIDHRAAQWPTVPDVVDQLTADEAPLALCAQTDPEAFFPVKGQANTVAKRICAQCPIRLRCLEVAIANNYRDGVWGGLSPRERAAIARRKERVA